MLSLVEYITDYYFPLMKIESFLRTEVGKNLILAVETRDKDNIIKSYECLVENIKNINKFEKINKYFNRFRVDLNNEFGLSFNYIYFQ